MMRCGVIVFLALAVSLPTPAQETDLKDLEKAIKSALVSADEDALTEAVRDAVSQNRPETVDLLLKFAAAPVGDSYDWVKGYWILVNGAASVTSEEALLAAANQIVGPLARKPLGRDLLSALTNRGPSSMVPAMHVVLQKGDDDMKLLAADHLITIGDKRSFEPLLEALRSATKDGLLRLKVGEALTEITGQDFGDSLSNWEGWWAANKDTEWQRPDRTGTRGGGTGTVADMLTRSRESEWERLCKSKILIVNSGTKYHCNESHDMDRDLVSVVRRMNLQIDTVAKGDLESNDHPNLDEYIAILCVCTHIREHCDKAKCDQCKPSSSYQGDRLYGCSCPINKHPSSAYLMGPKGKAKLKRFVEQGGYLFAEDWCMEDFVAEIFPGTVGHGPVRSEDETVGVLPKDGAASHPYLRKIFYRPPSETRDTMTEAEFEKLDHSWKIDAETRCIKIVDEKKVTTLLTSPDLEKYAEGNDAVAVTFAFGGKDGGKPAISTGGKIEQDRARMSGGRVMYVLSHFGKQKSKDDEYTLQNLLLNFLIEANERRARWEKVKKK